MLRNARRVGCLHKGRSLQQNIFSMFNPIVEYFPARETPLVRPAGVPALCAAEVFRAALCHDAVILVIPAKAGTHRANPAKVEDFGERDLLQHSWRKSFSAKRFHFAGMRTIPSTRAALKAPFTQSTLHKCSPTNKLRDFLLSYSILTPPALAYPGGPGFRRDDDTEWLSKVPFAPTLRMNTLSSSAISSSRRKPGPIEYLPRGQRWKAPFTRSHAPQVFSNK